MKLNFSFGRLLTYAVLFGILVLQTSCKKEDPEPPVIITNSVPTKNYDASVAVRWNKLFLEVSRYANGYRPPVSARALGYMGLSAYEAAVPGMSGYRSMGTYYNGLNLPQVQAGKEYHWPSAVNAAYATSFRLFFPHVNQSFQQDINNLEQTINIENQADAYQHVREQSIAFGIAVANAVYLWSTTDQNGNLGYLNNFPASYSPPQCLGCWQPTGPDFTPALLPYWGQVRPFAATGQDFQIPPPVAFSTVPGSPMHNQGMEVYEKYPLSYEDRWIAEYWGDDIFELTCEPAGRWISVANQAINQFDSNLETAVLVYAKLGMALCDGGIITWHNKYVYNVVRPSDYIQPYIDANWESHLLTLHNCINPPFPAYPSGHATFGAAAAGILNATYGTQVTFTDLSHLGRIEFNGTPRTFTSWNQMADENAYSRIPLGVHFQMDLTSGLNIGYQAANRVNGLPWN